MRLSLTVRLAFAALALASVAAPRVAEACGGTFCDTGPRAMPVDQTGENIVFVMEPGKVEAHIQIQYKGEAPKFSWILPVQALPEVEVGSQALFDRLLNTTVPTYTITTQFDQCGATSSSVFAGTVGGSSTGTGGVGGNPGGPPVVVFQKAVGAFDVTVLQGGTTPEVIKWLTDNLYQVPPNASMLLDGYVANHFLFVAVKLIGGAGLEEIHPLVVRYPGDNPCVPIKLTSVAALDDMGIRTFFLGTKRVAPKNYKHVVPNLVRLDWFNAATGYKDLVSRAVDSPLANGQAWVTEYAGPTGIVGAMPIASSSWNAAPFMGSASVGVVQLLQNQGFMSCIGNSCTYNHPLVLPLLRQYVPAPASLLVNGSMVVDPVAIEGYFYSCLACYQSKIDATKWDAAAFTSDLAKRIIDPAKHADALLQSWAYLTRMFTTMSPIEMTLDPEFLERDGLPNVPRINLIATQRVTCRSQAGVSQAGVTFPNGRTLGLFNQNTWPLLPNTMPWAESIEEIQATGKPLVLADNNAMIDSELQKWNAAQTWPPPSTTGSGPGPVTGPGTGPGGPGASGTGGAGGAGGSDGAAPAIDHGSCGCKAVGAQGPLKGPSSAAWVVTALLGLAGTLRRRRPS